MRKRRRQVERRSASRRLLCESLEDRMMLHAGAMLAGTVYVDADNDGTRDNSEPGIPGVVIELSGTDENGTTVNRSMLTDGNGDYRFDELLPGTYSINQQQPAAMMDGDESTPLSGATVGNDRISNLVIADDQEALNNDFAEKGLRPELISVRWFLASRPPISRLLRDTVAQGEALAGNPQLAQAILDEGETPPPPVTDDTGSDDTGSDDTGNDDTGNDDTGNDDTGNDDTGNDDTGNDDTGNDTPNEPFGPVTTGSFTDTDLRGIRTDLVAGAPPISGDHITTSFDYSGFSNPPTYGPHHGFLLDSDNNSITPRPTGVYSTAQPDEDLIHNLEHGHVWISYNPTTLSEADRQALEQLVIDGGTDTGVILTPRPENTSAIALASWARLQTLDAFDAAEIRAFVLSNRGHAPEGFIPAGQKPSGNPPLDGFPHS